MELLQWENIGRGIAVRAALKPWGKRLATKLKNYSNRSEECGKVIIYNSKDHYRGSEAGVSLQSLTEVRLQSYTHFC